MPGKKKRKKARTAKQQAATKKMLAANRAARRSGKRKVKARRTASRTSAAPSPSGKLKTRKKPRTAKQKAATKKMIAAAHRHERSEPKPRKKRHKKKGSKSGSRSKHHRSPKVRVVRAAQVKLPPHTTNITVAAIPSASRRSRKGKGKSKSSKRSRAAKKAAATRKRNKKSGWHTQIKRSAAAEHYPMENPLGVAEVLVGTFTGLLGFGSSELIDRLLATHALTGTTQPYSDSPPTTGDYSGLYNGTAILAPMDIYRWGAGLGLAIVPIAIASQVSDPIGRSALQMFGFGALMRVGGKGLTDLAAYLTSGSLFGNQVFINEQRAQAALPNATVQSSNLPTSGLGRLPAGVGGGHHGHWLSNGAKVPPPGSPCACGNNACGGCGGSAPRPPVRPPATSASSAQAANCPPPPPPPPPQIVQLPCAPQMPSILQPQTQPVAPGYIPVPQPPPPPVAVTANAPAPPTNFPAGFDPYSGINNPAPAPPPAPRPQNVLAGLPRGLSGTGAPPLAFSRLGGIRSDWGHKNDQDQS
jgi:hypothetical protein